MDNSIYFISEIPLLFGLVKPCIFSVKLEILTVFTSFFFFNVYLLVKDRESQSVSRGGAEGEGDTESEAGSRLRAVSPRARRGARTRKRRDHDLS